MACHGATYIFKCLKHDTNSMQMADDQIKTSIDALLDLIKVRGKSDINTIATSVGTAPSIVENWIKILEKGDMVKVTYELGKMYVAPLSAGASSKELNKKISVQEEILDTEFESKLLELKKISDMVIDLKSAMLMANKTYAEKLPDLQQKLNEINKIYEQVNKENAVAEKLRAQLEGTYDSVNAKVSGLMDKIKYLDSQDLGGLPSTIRSEQDLVAQAKSYEKVLASIKTDMIKRLNDAHRQFEKEVGGIRQDMLKQGNDTLQQLMSQEKELAKSNEALRIKMNVARGMISEVGSFNAEKNRQRMLLDKTVKDFTERYSKSYEAISKGMDILNKRSGELLSGIEAMKMSFGDASKVYDMLHDIQTAVTEAETGVNRLKDDVTAMRRELASLQTKNIDSQDRLNETNKLFKKSDDATKGMEGIRKELGAAVGRIKIKGDEKKVDGNGKSPSEDAGELNG